MGKKKKNTALESPCSSREPSVSKHDLGVLVIGDAGLWRAKNDSEICVSISILSFLLQLPVMN